MRRYASKNIPVGMLFLFNLFRMKDSYSFLMFLKRVFPVLSGVMWVKKDYPQSDSKSPNSNISDLEVKD